MNRYGFDIFDVRLTPQARQLLRPGKGLVHLKGEHPIYAARAIFPHLAGSEVIVDASRTLGVRRFTSNLPGDFGLRAIMGRLPEPDKAAR
jgi:hypothetical protein